MKPLDVHVLGVGAMGGLIAHELRVAHATSITLTLLLKSKSRFLHHSQQNDTITVNRIQDNGNHSTSSSKIPGLTSAELAMKPGDFKIQNLIVGTKTYQTLGALSPYIKYLDEKSTILFIHNGMGVIERVTEKFWPIEPQRPKLFKGVVTHGAYKTAPNIINHVGFGDIKLSYIPKHDEHQSSPMVNYITETPHLNGKVVDYNDFVLSELEKLMINACINPLTAVLDCLNGDLLYGTKVVDIMKRVIYEGIDVIRTSHAVLFSQIPHANTMFSPERLLDIVFAVIRSTSMNSSSMREDVRSLRQTEIDFINGYISQLGHKHGIPTPTNNLLIAMVKSKVSIEKALDESAADLLV